MIRKEKRRRGRRISKIMRRPKVRERTLKEIGRNEFLPDILETSVKDTDKVIGINEIGFHRSDCLLETQGRGFIFKDRVREGIKKLFELSMGLKEGQIEGRLDGIAESDTKELRALREEVKKRSDDCREFVSTLDNVRHREDDLLSQWMERRIRKSGELIDDIVAFSFKRFGGTASR